MDVITGAIDTAFSIKKGANIVGCRCFPPSVKCGEVPRHGIGFDHAALVVFFGFYIKDILIDVGKCGLAILVGGFCGNDLVLIGAQGDAHIGQWACILNVCGIYNVLVKGFKMGEANVAHDEGFKDAGVLVYVAW